MSNINNQRRSLLKNTVVASAALGVPLNVSATIAPILNKVQRSEFPVPDFEFFLGDDVFVVGADGTKYQAVIANVEDITFECTQHQRPTYLRECAKVVRFNIVNANLIESDIYKVEHPALGKMDLMLSPVPNADGEYGLEAVFN